MVRKYVCKICKEEYSYKGALTNHEKLEHQKFTAKDKKIIKASVIRSIIIAAFFTIIVGWFAKPYLLIGYDILNNNIPEPYITLTLNQRIENVNYLNFTNRCDDFHKFLSLGYKRREISANPSSEIFSYSVNNILNGKRYCAIYSPFTPLPIGLSETFLKEETNKEIECENSFCRDVSLHFVNAGDTIIDNIRTKVCFNKDLIISSVESDYIEQMDNNCFVFYRENNFEKDTIIASLTITVGHNHPSSIESDEIITTFSASHDWRGLRKEIKPERLKSFYRLYIENCEVSCTNLNYFFIEN